MTVAIILVAAEAMWKCYLFITEVLVCHESVWRWWHGLPEMLYEDFGNSLLEKLNVTRMAQVDGLQCAAHLRKQRLQSAFFDCGTSSETCACKFWNRTSNQPVVFELYGDVPWTPLKERENKLAFILFPTAFLLHAIPASVALLLGPFQLNPNFRNASIKRHKIFGYIYSLNVVIAFVGSVYLEAVTTIPFVGNLGLVLLSLGWVFTLIMGVWAIHSNACDEGKNILSHKRWMIRNYFLTFQAVMFRWWFIPLQMVFGKNTAYLIIVWLWVPQLILFDLLHVRRMVSREARLFGSTWQRKETLPKGEIPDIKIVY